MDHKKKVLVRICISLAIFRVGFFLIEYISKMLFTMSASLDRIITFPLLLLLPVFAWIFGGWLTKRFFGE